MHSVCDSHACSMAPPPRQGGDLCQLDHFQHRATTSEAQLVQRRDTGGGVQMVHGTLRPPGKVYRSLFTSSAIRVITMTISMLQIGC